MTPQSAFRNPRLVDWTGRPMAESYGWGGGGKLYRSPSNVRTGERPRPRAQLDARTRKNINPNDRRELINYSRVLRAQNCIVKGAIEQKNFFAFGDGWDVQYAGRNAAWGEQVTEYLRHTAFPFCNPRGENFDFTQTLLHTGYALDTDGGDLAIWTTKNRLGTGSGSFPQMKIVPATMIATTWSGNIIAGFENFNGVDFVKGGSFDGARIHDGIIYDRDNALLGVRIWGENDKGEMIHADIDRSFCQLVFEPEWSDQLQGIPRMATAIMKMLRIDDINEYITTAIAIASARALTRKTPDGMPSASERTVSPEVTDASGTVTQRQTTYEKISAGIYELRADEDLIPLPFDRPSMNEEEFKKSELMAAMFALGWPVQMMDVSAVARASARQLKEVVRQSVWSRQKTGLRRSTAMLRWFVAKSMKEGYIPRNDDGADPYMWTVKLPAEFTVDEGNDRKADIDDIKMGLTSRATVVGKRGESLQQIDAETFQETLHRADQAAAMFAKHPWKTQSQWLEWFEQRGPNLQAATPAPPDPEEPDAGKARVPAGR